MCVGPRVPVLRAASLEVEVRWRGHILGGRTSGERTWRTTSAEGRRHSRLPKIRRDDDAAAAEFSRDSGTKSTYRFQDFWSSLWLKHVDLGNMRSGSKKNIWSVTCVCKRIQLESEGNFQKGIKSKKNKTDKQKGNVTLKLQVVHDSGTRRSSYVKHGQPV